MRLRWLIGDYTHPGFPLTRAERRRIGRLVNQRFTPWRSVAVVSLAIFAPAVAACAAVPWLVSQTGLGLWAYAAGYAAICVVVWLVSAWGFAGMYAVPFRRAMREVGYNVCVRCGYSREGLGEGARCPECGGAAEV